MKLVKKVLSIFIIFIIAIALPFVVFTLITSRTGIIGTIRSFVIMTGSMHPTIPAGAVVYTLKNSNYEKGDIIAFTRNNITVAHRIENIIKKGTSPEYQTKGDANSSADIQLVKKSDVIGKEYVSLPYVGNFILLLRTAQGFALFVGLPTLLVVIMELFTIKKELEKEIEKKIRRKINTSFWEATTSPESILDKPE